MRSPPRRWGLQDRASEKIAEILRIRATVMGDEMRSMGPGPAKGR